LFLDNCDCAFIHQIPNKIKISKNEIQKIFLFFIHFSQRSPAMDIGTSKRTRSKKAAFELPNGWKMCYWVESNESSTLPRRVTCLVYYRHDDHYWYAAAMYHKESNEDNSNDQSWLEAQPMKGNSSEFKKARPEPRSLKAIKHQLRETAYGRAQANPRCLCAAAPRADGQATRDENFPLLAEVIRQCMRNKKYGLCGPSITEEERKRGIQRSTKQRSVVDPQDLALFVQREAKERAKKARNPAIPPENCSRCKFERIKTNNSAQLCKKCSGMQCRQCVTMPQDCTECQRRKEDSEDEGDTQQLCASCAFKQCFACANSGSCEECDRVKDWKGKNWDFTHMMPAIEAN
jgi:hypothetical protein